MKKNVKLLGLGSLALLVLSACGRGDVSSHSKGAWDQIVYAFAKAIEWLSFGGSVAIGIILFSIILRAALMPLWALFSFLSSWLSYIGARVLFRMLRVMTYGFPIMIFIFGVNFASGVALYWTVSNAFQVFQIMLLNNPFKIIEAREAAAREEKERKARIRRAQKKAHKKRK